MNSKLIAEVGKLDQFQTMHHITDGSWSLHELIEYVLQQTGSAHVRIASFALGEIAIRCLSRLVDENKIITLNCLFDKSCKRTKFDLLLFCSSIANIRLADNHMKLILIENNKWHVAINTSANLTPNKRTEAYVITTMYNDYRYYSNCYNELFAKATIQEYDVQ